MRPRSLLGNFCVIGKKFRGDLFDHQEQELEEAEEEEKSKHLVPFALIFEHDFA